MKTKLNQEAERSAKLALSARADADKAKAAEAVARVGLIDAEVEREKAETEAKAAKAEAEAKAAEAERVAGVAAEAEAKAAKSGKAEDKDDADKAKAAEDKARTEAAEADKASKDKAVKASEAKRKRAKAAEDKARAEDEASKKAEVAVNAEMQAAEDAAKVAREVSALRLKQQAAEEKAKALKAAKKAYCEKYVGKPADALAARVISYSDSGAVSAYDFMYNYIDVSEADASKRSKDCRAIVSAFSDDIIGKAKAAEAKARARVILAEVVKLASGSVNTVTAEVAADMEKLFSSIGCGWLVAGFKRRDYRAIVAATYTVDKDGDDAAKQSALFNACEAVAARKLRGMTPSQKAEAMERAKGKVISREAVADVLAGVNDSVIDR